MSEAEKMLAGWWETGNKAHESFIWKLIGSWCYGAFYYASQIGNHDDASLFLSATAIADCRAAFLRGGDHVS